MATDDVDAALARLASPHARERWEAARARSQAWARPVIPAVEVLAALVRLLDVEGTVEELDGSTWDTQGYITCPVIDEVKDALVKAGTHAPDLVVPRLVEV